MKELRKLELYLKLKNVNYRRMDIKSPDGDPYKEKHQIAVYDENGNYEWDVVCHKGSYGYESGLLEGMGSIFVNHEDGVVGWLTANDVIERMSNESIGRGV